MIKFKYKKANGEITDRVGVVIASPSKHYSVLDVSELTQDEQSTINDVFNQYMEEKTLVLQELDEKYGINTMIKKYFKHFNPEGIQEVESF